MNFTNPSLGLFALLAGLFWALEYTKLFSPAQIYLPPRLLKGDLFLKAIGLFLGLLSFSFIGYAMMGPRLPIGHQERMIEVNDIYFVVDVSRSMMAEDFRPNRLEAAKRKISEFVALRPTDRIGLIIFSDDAFTLLPLSTDLKLIQNVVSDIKIGPLGMGTNIGDALGLAVARGARSLAKNKVIILLTDGVNNVGKMTPLQAAESSKAQGIKIYTIGIGRRENNKVLKSGGLYFRIPGGSVDLKTLEQISHITGGKNFYASNEEALKKVLTDIERMEKTQMRGGVKIIYNELYHKFLLIGVILFLLTEISRKWVRKEAL